MTDEIARPTPSEALVEEIERKVADLEDTFPWALVFKGKEWRMIAASLRARPPEGMVLVPREPTDEILDAMELGPSSSPEGESWQDYQRRSWAMILAAASSGGKNSI